MDDGTAPRGSASGVAILFTDLTSGPTDSGPGGLGVPISIFGHGFGAAQGSSTVTIGGVEVGSVLVWGQNNAHNPALDMIVVQPGPKVKGGPIVVTVGGKSSNPGGPFTVRPGKIYVVATDGKDSADCSLAAPCKTLSHVASGIMKAGDTLLMRGGTYSGDDVWIRGDQGQSGAAGKPKVIKNYPGEEVEETMLADRFAVDADYITVSGLTFPNGDGLDLVGYASPNQTDDWLINNRTRGMVGYDAIGSTGQNHVIAGNDCELSGSSEGTEGHCFYIERGQNIQVLHNVASGEGGYGIHIHEEVRATPDVQRIIQNVRVEGNTVMGSPQRSGLILEVDDCDGTDMKCYGNKAEHIVILNNVFYGNNFAGVVLNGIASDVQVYNNTFYQNGTTSLVVGAVSPSQLDGVDVENNLFFQSKNSACTSNCTWFPEAHVQIDAAVTGVMVSNNYYGPGKPAFADGNQKPIADPDTKRVTGKVAFADPAMHDFHLHGGDAVIDKGLTLAAVAEDFDGVMRPYGPAYCIGAFEYVP